ncbi:MAG: sigma-54 dependent transcriptional regulator [Myxococcota bacterium]
MTRVLIVEDEPVIRGEIERVLRRRGIEVVGVGDVPQALAADPSTFDLVLTDLRLPGASGETLLEQGFDVPILVMTAHGSVRSAVAAMKRGAADYLTKPIEPDELALVVERTVHASRVDRQHAALRTEVDRRWAVDGLVGESPGMKHALDLLARVAPTDATVLVLGESGTGKELVARAVHARSPRVSGAFVAVNCAAIPEGLVESELFGHERGAFTGAVEARKGLFRAAHRGTLFLDEIGELPLAVQARLLRVLQDREIRPVGATAGQKVDVRVIAATHRDLPAMVAAGTFREDLYWRLRVVELPLPPLRDRGPDRVAVAAVLLAAAGVRMGRRGLSLSDDAVAAIEAYEWPGNVRELENTIERAVILHESGPVTATLLGLPVPSIDAPVEEVPDGSLVSYFRAFLLQHQRALSETELARRLGISRKTLWERRKRMGLPRP